MFGALQVTPSWLRTFGTVTSEGKYAITPVQKSLLNSIPWLGKLLGVIFSEPVNDRFGYKTGLALACIIQSAGVVIQSEYIDRQLVVLINAE